MLQEASSSVPWLVTVERLIPTVVVPIIVVVLGSLFTLRLKALDRRLQDRATMRDRRIARFCEMAPMLNDLYCFGAYVGHWRQMTADSVLSTKRQLDRIYYSNLFMWTPDFRDAYTRFLDDCFVTSSGIGNPAKSKASVRMHRFSRDAEEWRDEWSDQFVSHENRTNRARLLESYNRIHQAMAHDA